MDSKTPADGPKGKWYFKKGPLILSLIFIGPLALPLLWANPRYSALAKVFWSAVILGITIGLALVTHQLLQFLLKQLSEMSIS